MNQDDIDQKAWSDSLPPAKTVSAAKLTEFLVSQGIKREVINCLDDDYSLPTDAWVHDEFASSWESFLNGLNLKYQDESSDCDDFAAGCRWWAQYLQGRTRPGDSALAFFECALEGHAVVGIVSRDVISGAGTERPVFGPLKLLFYEPQPTVTTGGFAVQTLKPIEYQRCDIESILFLRF